MKNPFNNIADGFAGAWNDICYNASELYDDVKDGTKKAVKAVGGFVDDNIVQPVGKAYDATVDFVDDHIVEPVVGFGKDVYAGAKDIYDTVMPASKKDLANLQNTISDQKEEIQDLKEQLHEKSGGESSPKTPDKQSVLDAVKGLSSKLTSGKDSQTKDSPVSAAGLVSAAKTATGMHKAGTAQMSAQASASARRLPSVDGVANTVMEKAASIASSSSRALPSGAADIMAKSELSAENDGFDMGDCI